MEDVRDGPMRRADISYRSTNVRADDRRGAAAEENVTGGRAAGPAKNLSMVLADHRPLQGVKVDHREAQISVCEGGS